MSKIYSAGQYDKAYLPWKLGNNEVPDVGALFLPPHCETCQQGLGRCPARRGRRC